MSHVYLGTILFPGRRHHAAGAVLFGHWASLLRLLQLRRCQVRPSGEADDAPARRPSEWADGSPALRWCPSPVATQWSLRGKKHHRRRVFLGHSDTFRHHLFLNFRAFFNGRVDPRPGGGFVSVVSIVMSLGIGMTEYVVFWRGHRRHHRRCI